MENLLLRLMCKNEIKKCNLEIKMFDDLEYIKQIEADVLNKIKEYSLEKDKINYYFITDRPKNIGTGQYNFSFRIDENNKFRYCAPKFGYILYKFDIKGYKQFELFNLVYNNLEYYTIIVTSYNNIVKKIKIDSNKTIEENLKAEFVLPIGTRLPSEWINDSGNKTIINDIWEHYIKRANELFVNE